MSPWGVWCSRALGLVFTFTVWLTVLLNYVLSAGCGDKCYADSDTPTGYPDQLFISTTMQKSPTRVTGVIGFSICALAGVLLGLGRYWQVKYLIAVLPPFPLRRRVENRNRASLKYLFVFAPCLVLLSAVPAHDDQSLSTNVHYISVFLCFAALLAYLFIQISSVEFALASSEIVAVTAEQAPLLNQQPESRERLWGVRLKILWLLTTLVTGCGFVVCVNIWSYIDEDSPFYVFIVLAAEAFELLTVLMGSCFIGLTDFTSIQESYLNQQPSTDLSLEAEFLEET